MQHAALVEQAAPLPGVLQDEGVQLWFEFRKLRFLYDFEKKVFYKLQYPVKVRWLAAPLPRDVHMCSYLGNICSNCGSSYTGPCLPGSAHAPAPVPIPCP